MTGLTGYDWTVWPDWPEVVLKDDFKKIKVAMLKAHLKAIGRDISGKKVDLIDRIKDHYTPYDHEDQAAIRAMDDFRVRAIEYGVVASWFRFCLNFLGGILPVMMVGGSLWFWSSGSITAGDIAAKQGVRGMIASDLFPCIRHLMDNPSLIHE